MRLFPAVLALTLAVPALLPFPATAQGQTQSQAQNQAQSAAPTLDRCTTRIEGEDLELLYNPADQMVRDNRSLRERWLGAHGDGSCPAYVTLRYLTPDLDDTQRGPFCLVWDKEAKTYAGFNEGDRDAYLACTEPTRSVCERVNDTASTAAMLTGLREPETEAEAELRRDASGATILTGTPSVLSEYVTGVVSGPVRTAITGILGSAVTAVGAPVAAATLVAVGGAVYVCADR